MFGIMTKNLDPKDTVFLDACAGSGAVSKHASELGYKKIISNDIMEFPSHIVRGALAFPVSDVDVALSIDLIGKMNALSGTDGFFSQNYSESSGRIYFSDPNAKKIDACRIFIEDNVKDNLPLKSYLLYCLLEALSAASNTTGVQAAFLKKLKDRALKPLHIKVAPVRARPAAVEVYSKDILMLLNDPEFRQSGKEDLLYIDPPYNERQYGPNYHLYETLVRYDNPKIHGKTGLREWVSESKSDFCSKKTCLEFTRHVVNSTTAKEIYISYNSDGLLSKDEIISAFPKGKCTLSEMEQRRYKSDSSTKREYDKSPLKEYLFRIVK
jgi:adenine-specific DNA-methyltransferase